MNKVIYEVGVIDLPYQKKVRDSAGKVIWFCPYFSRWRDMIRRCYSEKELLRNPSYRGVSVCDSWKTFSNFKVWMENSDWEGKTLDKDLLGNSKLYSPTYCVWISAKLNSFLCGDNRKDTTSLVGACFQTDCGMWRAQCKNPFAHTAYKRRGYIGIFHSEEDAHEAWRSYKEKYAIRLAIAEDIPHSLKVVLKNKYSKESWYKQPI